MANTGAAAGAIFLIILIAGGLILYTQPTIAQGIGNFFQNLLNGTAPWQSGGGGGSANATGAAWFAFTLHFSDGTTQDINMNPTLSLFPFSITFQGKTVTQLDMLIRANLVGDNMGAWSAHASQHIEVYLKPETTPKTSSTASFDTSGSSWPSGTTKTLISTPITSSTLDSFFQTYGAGDWLFQTTGSVDLTVTVNGISQSLTATLNAGGVDLSENPSFSILSVTSTFQSFPLR